MKPHLLFKCSLPGIQIRFPHRPLYQERKNILLFLEVSFQIGKWKQQKNMDFVRKPAGTDTLICLCCDFEKEVAMLTSANRKIFIVILCVKFWKNQAYIKRYFLFYLFLQKKYNITFQSQG